MPRILSVQPASHTQNPKARGIMSNRANDLLLAGKLEGTPDSSSIPYSKI